MPACQYLGSPGMA